VFQSDANELYHTYKCVSIERKREWQILQCVAVCCSVLQCVAVCCSVSRSGANELHHTYE